MTGTPVRAAGSGAGDLPAASSYATLSVENSLKRLPRVPGRPRDEAFTAAFDARTLFYDCFWHMDGKRVLLVGPPPYSLWPEYKAARFVAKPSGEVPKARFHASLSTMITELVDVPAGTTVLEVTLAGETFALPVQPNSCAELAGKRILFSINKDNELGWIREWANYHARVHGTDAVILVDNGSTSYQPADVGRILADIGHMLVYVLPSWPYSFGPIDKAVRTNPYWARFLQIGSMSMVLRRYGERAYGLLDCDIDELAGTTSGRSIYDLAHESRGGLIAFRGTWIEPGPPGPGPHRDYSRRLTDPDKALSRQRKWVLDPSRPWVRRLSVHPYWHWIEGRALFSKSMPEDAHYWHFKGINTNWKQARTTPPAGSLEPDPLLVNTMARYVGGP